MSGLRLALVGAGRIAGAYSEVLAGCEDVEVVGVADVLPEAAEAAAARLDCPAHTSYDELLEDRRPEAALICTPPDTHSEIAVSLLERGVHVMCEKPLSVSSAAARRMLDTAEANEVILTMATKFRYVDDVIKAKSIVDSGILGEVILIENTFASRVDMSGRWNSDPSAAGGGVLIDNGTHSVDLTRFFLGPIDAVMAVEGRRVQGLLVEDTAQLFLRSHEGIRATIDLSWSINKERDAYLDIYGSAGTIRIGWSASRYRQTSSPDWVEFGHGYDKNRALKSQLCNFAGAIRGTEPLRITAEDALASVQVIEAAYRSMANDGWVGVERRPASMTA